MSVDDEPDDGIIPVAETERQAARAWRAFELTRAELARLGVEDLEHLSPAGQLEVRARVREHLARE